MLERNTSGSEVSEVDKVGGINGVDDARVDYAVVSGKGEGVEKTGKSTKPRVAFFRPESRRDELSRFEGEFDVLHVPFIGTAEDREEIERFRKAEFSSAIVTSVTAVEILEKHGLIERLRGRRVIAIGNKTAEKLGEHGIECEVPEKFDSKSVVKEFRGKLEGRVALLRSDRGDPVLLEVGDADEFRLYRIVFLHGREQERVIEEIAGGKVDFAVFSSRMMVRSFFSLCEKMGLDGREVLGNCRVIAIGPPTKGELERMGVKCHMPDEYTFDGILRLLKKLAGSG